MNKALILDSDLYFIKTLQMFFGRKNIEAIICSDALQAKDLMMNNEFDFIVSSTQLNHKSGLELVSWLKIKSMEKNIPFILITPTNNPEMNASYLDLEPDAIFHKSVDLQDLLTTISNLQLNRPVKVNEPNLSRQS